MAAHAATSGASPEDAAPAKPFAPTPGGSASRAAGAANPDDIVKASDAVAATATAETAPATAAAKSAAAKAEPPVATGGSVPKAAVKPATAAAKAAAGQPLAAPSPKTGAPAKTHESATDPAAPVSNGKAAALVTGSGAAKAGAKASAAATGATGAPKAAAKAVSPTSAAAVMVEGLKPVSAIERQAAIGSVLATGPGAVAEPPAKAKAKAKAGGAAKAGKAGADAGAGYPKSTAAVPKVAATMPAKVPAPPATVLDIVTGTPQPVLESTVNAVSQQGPGATAGAAIGPAKAYAKLGAPAIASIGGVASAGGKPLEVPKAGPAAVAVGRAVAAGASEAIKVEKGKARAPIGKKFQIVFVTGEVAPYSKTGGLGEAMDGLPVALAALGHRVMVISPRYDQYEDAWDTSFWSSVTMAGKEESVHFFHAYKQKVDYVFADHACFLERVDAKSGSKLYGPEWGKDFADNQARYAYFCKAACLAIKDLPLGGAVYGDKVMVVANDWHTALVPMFIDAERQANASEWKHTKTAFLCHNAVFQGRFVYEEGIAEVLGVPQQYVDSITFNMPLKVGKYNEKVKCFNTMAAGLRYSDRVLTVSPSYAKECTIDPEKGVELEELFALGRCTGILNGVKEGVSPSDKNFVTKTKMNCGPFTLENFATAKAQLKAIYRQESGLPETDAPMLCFIGRLDAQKGYDLLLEALVEVLEDTDIQVVIVGAGRADLVQQTKAVEAKFPSKLFYAGWMGPERYAMLAGCDYTLLPSRWEPCGLVQMEAMRLGTLPIVAPTGGLKDTVEDGVNGLWTDCEMTVEADLDDESSASIAKALRRAAELHVGAPEKEEKMKRAAMAAASEFTWSNAALQYEALFEELGVQNLIAECKDSTVTLEDDKQVC